MQNEWNNLILIPDTNVLLDLYSLDQTLANKIWKAIISFNDRAYLSGHVFEEFKRNHDFKISGIQQEIEATTILINEHKSRVENHHYKSSDTFTKIKHNTPIWRQLPDFTEQYERIVNKYSIEMSSSLEQFYISQLVKMEDLLANHPYLQENCEDIWEKQVQCFFKGEQRGDAFESGEKQLLSNKADTRLSRGEPTPGSQDSDKTGLSRWGDYYIWKEMIKLSQDRARPILFVSSDNKKDWGARYDGGKHFFIHKTLADEFTFQTNGQSIFMLSLKDFISFCENVGVFDQTNIPELDIAVDGE